MLNLVSPEAPKHPKIKLLDLAPHLAGGVVRPAGLVEGQDDEAAAAADLDDAGEELGVDGAEVGVVRVARDLDVLVGLGLLGRRAVDVAELGRADPAEDVLLDPPPAGLLALAGVQHFQNCFSGGRNCGPFLSRLLFRTVEIGRAGCR